MPLFPGYLFFDIKKSSRVDILKIDGVVEVLQTPDQRTLSEELLNLYMAIRGNSISWRDINFNVAGTPVEVVGGPLKGVAGEFVRFESNSHLIIRISILGRSIETLIDEAYVKPLV